jgi:hypothetical protein
MDILSFIGICALIYIAFKFGGSIIGFLAKVALFIIACFFLIPIAIFCLAIAFELSMYLWASILH